MSLNEQCWNCRWRRVRCDSRLPACSKCMIKGLDCAGYSNNKPLKWRHRITQRQQPAASSPVQPSLHHYYPNDDGVPSHMAHETVSYYNSMIAPDLSANARCSYSITTSTWANLEEPAKHLYVCVVALHKIVRSYESVKGNQMLIFRHKASAARQLQQMIQISNTSRSGPFPLGVASMFISSEVQQSAYGNWRTHLEGAKALASSWAGSPLEHHDFTLYNIAVVDIYGTTMAPSKLLSKETLAQHIGYLKSMDRLDVDIPSTLTPIPAEILRATIAINIHRAATVAETKIVDGHCYREEFSLAATLASLQCFDPHHWTTTLSSIDARNAASWALLATCFQTATIIYLFQSDSQPSMTISDSETFRETRKTAYQTLFAAITEIFQQRLYGGTHYKFILWPMVVCGIETATRKHNRPLQFLCQALETITLDLGTLAMREAAAFLNDTWDICKNRPGVSADRLQIEWDEIFRNAPIFLM